jgi:FtsP/CotA-like multicopper oxidase with cupredoxin domain
MFAPSRLFSETHGYAVFHCRILEHEDQDMMRPYEILG